MAGLRGKLVLGVGTIVVTVLALEGAMQWHQRRLRATEQPSDASQAPSHIVTTAPFLYRLNPAHPEINERGLRDREYAVPKPPDTWRVLVLGDSIVYGSGFRREELFTERLEAALGESRPVVEIMNAGVRGYTTYNEVLYYETEGRDLGADVILLCVCLNDIVNPRTHWGYAREAITNIPAAAIPNDEVDRRVARPFLRGRDHPSALVRSLAWRRYNAAVARSQYMPVGERRWPVYLAEETTRIDRWMSDTPEWRWFTNLVLRLRDTAAAQQARLALVIFPLAYQMENDYPFRPGARIASFAASAGIPALDLDPVMRGEPDAKSLFLVEKNDIWHLSATGHARTAEWLGQFLADAGLLPGVGRSEPPAVDL
ncbi:MAG TPA: SGNH/GDSL hydrolase family protein [Kiritimatiellia bacterium]|nr:SGNH/GDSL hydrolase family protein [Kiritimatiellia bacterium]